MTYDLLVIGAGPGGYVAAIRAAQLGLKVAVVERRHLGGVCLNWGCIPTKALLRSAEVYGYMKDAAAFGLKADGAGFDLGSIVARSRAVSARLNGGVAGLFRKNKVPVIWGEARFAGAGRVTVAAAPDAPVGALGAGEYEAKHILIATGASPRAVPGLTPDGERIWTYYEAMTPKSLPKSLLIVGSGAIGSEFASFYNALGVEVTLVEMLERILPLEDADVSDFARKRFAKAGIRVRTGARVAKLAMEPDRLVATLEAGGQAQDIAAERVIVAAGVSPNTAGLGLEALGVELKRGFIATDGFGRASVRGVYAIGDVAGGPMLAHKAEHEAVHCVEAIAGLAKHPFDKDRIPACTYSHPQIASVGLTEAAARAAGHELRIGRFPFAGNGKAIALRDDQGFVKTIFDAGTGKLLGAHMVGPEVTELIQGFVLAMNLETTEEELMHAILPHPTLSEAMHESVLDAWGRAIHK
jgi:dihydrolipoamide dehydrogenase